MPELNTMNCPSCGGALQIKPGDTFCICPYCGNRHTLTAQPNPSGQNIPCPECGQSTQVHRLKDLATQPKFAGLLSEATQAPHMPTLPAHPMPPTDLPPAHRAARNSRATIMLGVFLIIFLFSLAKPHSSGTIFPAGLLAILLITFLLPRPARPPRPGRFNRPRSAFLRENLLQREEDIRRHQRELEQFERLNATHQKALARLEKSLYCERDDTVFIPGENSHTSRQNLPEFLRREG